MGTTRQRVVAMGGIAVALALIAVLTQAGPATPQQAPPAQQVQAPPPPAPTPPQAPPPAPTPPQAPPPAPTQQQQPPPTAGRDVAAVARANGRTESEINELFEDPSVHVGANNKIFYVEPPAAEKAAGAALPPEMGPFPYTDTFLLHSRPGAQRTIYLDFDGHQVTDTAWTGWNGAPNDFFASAYSLDGSAAFSTTEQDAVQSVWQRVAEDFAPFNVDVTTQDPGDAGITRNGSADQIYGTRALITNTTTISDACTCGGVAFLDVFNEYGDHAYYQPAFVFTNRLGYDTKNIAEATSHEVGHNLDLVHDGTSTSGYYRGHDAWAPIMGAGYDRPISQWSKGEYTGANSAQDDLATIASNGAALLADDHGNTSGSATVVVAGATANGIVTTDADVDVFRVDAPAGPAAFLATPALVSPNLDIRLELQNGSGTVLASNDPASATVSRDVASGLAASVSASLPAAGTYYLFVSGVGAALPASTGYSGYGSVGGYTLSTAGLVNDNFAGASVVAGSTGTANGGNVAATKETGEPSHAGFPGGASVWYRWTAPASDSVTIDTFGSSFDTLLGVYTGGAVDSLTTVAGNDDSGGRQSSVTFPAVAGTTYYVAVDGYGGAFGAVTLHWAQAAPPAAPTLAINDVTVTEGNAGTTAANFAVTRSGDTSGTATVKWRTATSGTATSGDDYTAVPNTTLTFSPGQTTRTATVNVIGDVVSEADESYSVVLSMPTGATISDTTGAGWITNDDGAATPPSLAVGDVTVTEGNAGTTAATFVVTRTGPTAGTSTVKWRTATSGTATSGTDYTAVPITTLTFTAGQTTRTVTVNVSGDVVGEADEYFFVILSAPTNATISDTTGAGFITNDDGSPALAVGDVTVTEGNGGTAAATFVVTRTGPTGGTSTVKWRTAASGTATSGVDYAAVPTTTLTFAPGQVTATVTVNVIGDVVGEANEYFFVVLSNPTGATIADTTGRGWINNDDG